MREITNGLKFPEVGVPIWVGILQFSKEMGIPPWEVSGEGPTNSAKLKWFYRFQTYVKAKNLANKEMERKAKRK